MTSLCRINLGCGLDKVAGYVNVDKRPPPYSRADVTHDLDERPWPFADGSAGAILAMDVFEHLDDVVGALDECRRILAPGGLLTIRGPLAGGPLEHIDVTHRRAFVEHSFDHFDWSTELGQRYRYGSGSWRITERRREGDNVVFVLVKPEIGQP